MGKPTGIRIGEVAKRSGVPVSTVKHYYREGLLPDPVLKRRNSAYYSEDTVERVVLIRRLQDQAYLPLRVVKELFERSTDPSELRKYLPGRDALVSDEQAVHVPAAKFTGAEGMSEEELERLETLGLLDPHESDGEKSYDWADAQVLEVLVRMRKLGLTPERGFGAERLLDYRKHIKELVGMELTMAFQGMVGRMEPDQLHTMAAQLVEEATQLVAALHRKEIARILGVQPK